jgi:hypothetical protein
MSGDPVHLFHETVGKNDGWNPGWLPAAPSDCGVFAMSLRCLPGCACFDLMKEEAEASNSGPED